MSDEKTKIAQPSDKRQPYRVGGPLNYFGTRRRRRIECQACGKVDYVSFVPKEGQKVYCGACAREELALFEEGEKFPTQQHQVACPECGRMFDLPEHLPETEDLLCIDCHMGFETWQGVKGAIKGQKAYKKGSSGTILRRNTKSDPKT